MPSTNRPEYAVRIEDGPGWISDTGVGPSFRYHVWARCGDESAYTTGETPTVFQAWVCALATLKGLMLLERSRH